MPDSMAASAVLAQAEALQDKVRHRSLWYARYLRCYGAAAFVMTLMLCWGKGWVVGSVALWGVVIAALSVYAARQPVARRGFGRRHRLIIGCWAVLYAAVLVPGTIWFQGEPVWWLPGAVLVSLPAFIGAHLEGRR
ncbi:hypothetical protein SAMN04489712_111142 [Thermomonospora echinospora]|uniref:Uncharacterized protein n=1 Tax=Thermomonospora echinospora TaxID=1992 RepID=A0A1H6CT91_9ACTN|nr:hypothetical protein [Thermomonospora echinospora]SEG76259.1 hypothetical protein SAMN04489712_111142 [Thermomonospora echinospora]